MLAATTYQLEERRGRLKQPAKVKVHESKKKHRKPPRAVNDDDHYHLLLYFMLPQKWERRSLALLFSKKCTIHKQIVYNLLCYIPS